MKKLIIILSCLVLAAGCEKGLEPEIFGTLNPTTFPETETDFELYAMQVYIPFGSKWAYEDGGSKYPFFGYEEGHVQLFDGPTDLFTVFTGWGEAGPLWESKSRGNFEPMVSNWRDRSHFEKTRFVTRTTKIIDDLENTQIFRTEEARNQLIAEVKMARSWTMFFMLYLFDPVPVILDPSKIGTDAESDLTRPSRAEYVNAMINDLNFAAENLPRDAKVYGRFNKGIALTVLMRLYMNEHDFENAERVGREIADLGYSLVDDYISLFRAETSRNSETIFAVSTDETATGARYEGNFNAYYKYCFPGDYPEYESWGAVFVADWGFFDSFDPADARRGSFIDSYINRRDELVERSDLRGAIVNKYPPEGTTLFKGNDIPLARYADILLMLAEAINENNNGPNAEAIGYVNEVRDRAGIGPLPEIDVASKEAFNNAILRERAWELFFEGLRKFDLVRHGKWPEALLGVNGKDPGPHLVPIPQYILDIADGKIMQNDGY